MGRDPDYDPVALATTPIAPFSSRPVRDRIWAIALIVCYVGTLVGGFGAYYNVNPKFFQLSQEYLNDPNNCPIQPEHGRHLLSADDTAFSAKDFLKNASMWLTLSAVASFGVAAAFLHLVRHHAHTLTRATIAFQLAVPIVMALGSLFSGNFASAIFASVLGGITFWVFYMWRREIGVASRLLSVAGHGLASNASLIGVTISLNIAALVLAVLPTMSGLVAFAVGDVVPNPARKGHAACVDEFGDGVLCCSWQPTGRATALIASASFTAVWTMLTMQQVRVFTTAGTIAQWYFTPPGTPMTGAASRTLKTAVSKALGTNALAGLVLTFTSAVKQQAQQEQQNGEFSLFSLVASCLASIYEYLTKFATVFAAISGDGLLTSGKKVTDLLARNLLEAFAITIWFPSAVMGLASVTLSAAWGFLVWGSYNYLHGSKDAEMYHSTNAIVLGVVVGAFTLFVLQFLAGMLLSVLDAVFVCFAIDKDRQAVANAEIFEALLGVAEERGVLVEGPDGELGYGAAHEEAPYAPPRMQ